MERRRSEVDESGTQGRLSEGTAREICRRLYVEPRRLTRLAGYENDNFRLEDADGNRFVLKVSPAAADRRRLELELALLDHLEAVEWPGTPRCQRSRHGRPIERFRSGTSTLDVRLLSWVEGRQLCDAASRSPRFLEGLGEYLAGLDLALADFAASASVDLPPALWNLAEPESWPDPVAVEPVEDRRRVEGALDEFAERLAAADPAPRRGLVHADANDHNLLVGEGADGLRVRGLIDFGDAGTTVVMLEIAIAGAYVGLASDDPWGPVPSLVGGYTARAPLTEGEFALLLPAIRGRLALSLAMAAARRRRGTADPYVLVSERPARRSLALLSRLSEEEAMERVAEWSAGVGSE